MENRPLEYDYTIAKWFMFTSIALGIVGMLIGVIIAFQLAFPGLNVLIPGLEEYTTLVVFVHCILMQ